MLVGIFQVLVVVVDDFPERKIPLRDHFLAKRDPLLQSRRLRRLSSAAFKSGGHWREGDDRRLPDDLLAAPEGP